jgi:X-X-X-Leu-X-X-Gly heptad repeat protein
MPGMAQGRANFSDRCWPAPALPTYQGQMAAGAAQMAAGAAQMAAGAAQMAAGAAQMAVGTAQMAA